MSALSIVDQAVNVMDQAIARIRDLERDKGLMMDCLVHYKSQHFIANLKSGGSCYCEACIKYAALMGAAL